MSKKSLLPIQRIIVDKRIAVIGNAESILSATNGEIIDEHDIVIRINMGNIVDRVAQGYKTHILASSILIDPAWIEKYMGKVKLLWLSPKWRENSEYFKQLPQKPAYYPVELWEKLSANLDGARPSSGMMAIDLAYRLKAKQINLFGFDFKKTKTFYLKEDHIGPHDWSKEQTLANKIVDKLGGRIY